MTDKVQKIREEVARLKEWQPIASPSLNKLLSLLDSIQEEPVSSIWHDASESPIIDKTFLLVAPNGNSSLCLWGGMQLHSVTIGGGHSVLCKGDIYSYIDDLLNLDNSCKIGKNLQEVPVSEELEEASKNYALNNTPWDDCKDEIQESFKAGANWQKEQMMAKAIDGLVICDKELTQGYKDIVFSMPKDLKVDDKVKMILIKED